MSRASVHVRPVDLGDIPALVSLTRSFDLSAGTFSGRPLLDSSEDRLSTRFAEIISDGSRHLLVAVDDSVGSRGGIVGLLVTRCDEIGAIDLTPVLHVSHLLVDPRFRRRGIGRQLLGAVVHMADERGIDHVLATAASGSREGNRYLARIGFAPLVSARIASTSVLRRTLGMADAPERIAVLRRARLVRGTRGLAAGRVARRGA
ncbi:MAG TPA: GNAT family N-acetyltransferase [Jatrophihabitantaceae bacterium]|nr:GNAT family N-acetyltransferase [Jatrophihabitantaceae bacterium]